MRTRRGSWRFGGLLPVVIGLGVAMGSAAPATAQASGPVLIDEDFQGASVAAEFQGYGSACLTGAAPVVAAAPGEHPLTGCSAVGVGPVPPAGGAPDGYLQLTDAANDQAGALLSETPIPSTTADAAAGTVVNTATTTGAAPDGSGVTSDPASATVTLVAPAPPSGTAALADSGSSSRGGALTAGIAIALLGALLAAAGPRRGRTTRSPNC
ncbi:hypothetical protein ACI2IX_19785 [Leifsonia aquatica]|uniref:hypothetical protein n=1 Tax=Leifsonia aquatica TaxID=144185 RepID=UPI00384A8FC2